MDKPRTSKVPRMRIIKFSRTAVLATCALCFLTGIALFGYTYRFGVVLPTTCVMTSKVAPLPSLNPDRANRLMSVHACVSRVNQDTGLLTVLISNDGSQAIAIEDMRCLTETRVTGILRPPYQIGAPNSLCVVTPVRPYERVLVTVPILLHPAYKPEAIVRDLISREGFELRFVRR
jgi:hypothetical protein